MIVPWPWGRIVTRWGTAWLWILPIIWPSKKKSLVRSFLLRRVATFWVSFRPVALKAVAKPALVTLVVFELATFSWLPPTLAKSGVCLVFSSMLRSGTLRLPAWKTIVPSCSISALAMVGSDLPPITGRTRAEPWRLAEALAVTVTPTFFSEARKPLSSASLVVPEEIGS